MDRLLLIVANLFLVSGVVNATSIEDAVHLAIHNSPLIALSESKQRLAEVDLDRTHSNGWMSLSMNWNKGEQHRKSASISGDGREENYRSNSASLKQPLFRGFQSIHERQAKEHALTSMKHEVDEQLSSVALSAVEAYLNVLQSNESFDIYKEIMRCSGEILRLAKQKHRLKLMSQAQLASYQSDYWQLESQFLNVQKTKSTHLIDYRFIIGEDAQDLLMPAMPSTYAGQYIVNKDIKQQNPTALKYKARQEEAGSTLSQQKGALLPSIDLIADYEKQESVLYLDNENLESMTYYISVSLPIFDRGSRIFDIQVAKERELYAKEEFQFQLSSLENELNKIQDLLLISHRAFDSYLELENSSKKQVNEYVELLKRSAIDRVTVLEAKVSLNQIKLQRLETQVELLKQYYKLQSLVGPVSLTLTKDKA